MPRERTQIDKRKMKSLEESQRFTAQEMTRGFSLSEEAVSF